MCEQQKEYSHVGYVRDHRCAFPDDVPDDYYIIRFIYDRDIHELRLKELDGHMFIAPFDKIDEFLTKIKNKEYVYLMTPPNGKPYVRSLCKTCYYDACA
eukprot:Pgem_evm1s3149